ncbi:LytTR family DNA-binding domain-containing protein [Kordia sp.]|uniref:LytR/AlgR family response regulator transcription factor n=1 Tax=Kordia sp. TaxID=1965332 RepID=UPI0025BD455B|nr:LytTR family DNA-binding domain-containing protein [Kordia sp.]MCH2196504.1 LytTR family DNA-binding domain-containing protein [Kordia sp.]
MNKSITAILVDDEINARENLRYLLNLLCKQVTIVGEAANVDDAKQLINQVQPQLVFLDIQMPEKSGFQLLDAFQNLTFQVIFITAYDHYAIKAFRVSAIDYLLKPIDTELLQKAVQKVEKHLEHHTVSNRISTLKENKKQIQKIAIPYKNDYVIINIKDILCMEADRMYTIIHTVEKKQYIVAKKLRYYEDLLKDHNLVRVHRSWLIHLNHIETYSKKERAVTLNPQKKVPVSKGFKTAFEEVFHS